MTRNSKKLDKMVDTNSKLENDDIFSVSFIDTEKSNLLVPSRSHTTETLSILINLFIPYGLIPLLCLIVDRYTAYQLDL